MDRHEPRVLVPVDVSTEERPDPELLELFQTAEVVLLGWYPVPHQTAPEQLQREKEAEAVDRIEAIAADFPDDGADVETLVVFTRDRSETVDRVAEEYACDVVVVPDEVDAAERVLVPLRSDTNVDRILAVLAAALEESDVSVTLFHAAPEDEEDETVGELLLESAMADLVDAGVDPNRIETTNVTTPSPVDAIADAAVDQDVLVIGETEPSLVDRILGDVPSQIIDRTDQTVLVVRDVA